MSTSAAKATLSIRVRLFSAFLFTGLLVSFTAIALYYYHNQIQTKDARLQTYQTIAEQVRYRTEQNKRQINDQLMGLSNLGALTKHNKLTANAMTKFAQILEQQPRYQSISIGYMNGDLQKFVALDKPESAQYIHQVKGAKWLLVSIQKNSTDTLREEFYFDSRFHFLSKFKEITTGDITTSEWYKAALSESTAATFQSENSLIYSKKLKTTKAVIAIEVSLNSNANILRNNNVSSQPSEIYFFTEKGDLLATSNAEKWKSPSHSPYPLLIKLVESEALNQSHEIKVGSQHYETYLTNVMSEANTPSYLAMLVPKQSLLLTELKTVIYIVLLCLVLSILLSWIFSTPISKALNRLNIALNKAKNEGYKTFSSQPTRFLALNNINTAFSEMSHLIAEQTIKHSGRATLFASLNAQLIDNKTHYNQHNINRFPALTNMLGIAASKSNLTEFSAITLADETQINLFQNTAWANLYHHLSTDQVVNKGSKLDVPYNRIHEIRMRFEVLWRDAEIYYYQQSKANPGLNKPLKEALIKEQLQLMRDFEFIAKVNQGYNKLTARDQLRLQQLSEKTWLRYFDSSMGLSAVEAIHIAKKKQKLPATESLLNNQQADIHGELGELYNLSITQGTATDEQERQAKQQLDSIKTMFNELSNKKQSTTVIDLSMYHGRLSAVPYPENQSDHDLSVTEHIMLLSNIFVTLTSIDSPIKSTLSLSQAIAVLYQISTDKHLDLATFKLFLTSGVYQQYAQQYLHPSQIDAVDIEPYLANEH